MDACSLRSDLVQFPFGDLTEIGSRGVNLSGGQKARIALARAAYGDDSVVLLDDPLAAVDARVARAIFDNCIGPGGIMEGRTRVLVTHGIGVLKDCDCVLAMKGGRLVEATSDIVEEVVAAEDGDNESDGTVEVDADKEKDRVGSAKKQDDSDVNETNNNGKLISVEESKQGSVGSNTYLAYIRACGILGVCTFLLLAISAQFLAVARNLWLAHWANQNEGSGTGDSTGSSVKRNLMVYAALGMTQTVFVAAQQLVAKVWCALRASRNLHTEMLGTVVRAPQWWFDTVPLGRILNRFTSDVNMVDQKLVRDLSGWVYDLFVVLSVIIVDSVATPALLMFIFPLAFVYFSVGRYYVSSSRELQRLQSTTKSPVFQHFSETLNGISTIRAFGQARDFTTEARSKLDDNLRARFARFSANRWLAVRLEGIGALIVFGTALFAVLAIVRGQGRIDASVVGLIISYALSLGDSLSWLVRECEMAPLLCDFQQAHLYPIYAHSMRGRKLCCRR
jgi:ABC-type multidrug transport system fused ATPase/permease subunit